MEIIAVQGMNGQAGAITYWRLQGSTDYHSLRDQWLAAGLPQELLPKPVSRETALRRAVNGLRSTSVLVRSLEAGGYALVEETKLGDDLDFDVIARAKLDEETGELHVSIPATDSEVGIEESDLRELFDRELGRLSHDDVSKLLVKCSEYCKAVSLRDAGGIYFVPRSTTETWGQMATVIGAASSSEAGFRVFNIPALETAEAIEAILDALSREATEQLTEVQRELDAQRDGVATLGVRALSTRLTKLGALSEKLSTYEELLGIKMPEVQEQLMNVKANVTLTSLVLAAEQG